MKRFIIFLTIQFFFSTCSIFEPYDKIYYYNVGAEGYAYYEDKPVSDLRIHVRSSFKYRGEWRTKHPIDEVFTSDSTGFFCVKLIRRAAHEDVTHYHVVIANDTLQNNKGIDILPKDIQNLKQNIQLGKIILIRKIL